MPEVLDGLTSKMRNCAICKDLELGPKPIFRLSKHTKILIAGQAPGRLAHCKNRPFDDPSGDRLRSWLGVNRTTFYEDERIGIFPIGLCFPGTGSGGDNPPRAKCAATWRSSVMDALSEIELTLVLGRYAIAWHLPKMKNKPLTEVVRLFADGRNGVIVLPHPSPRNNRWLKKNSWFEADILPELRTRVKEVLND